MNLTDVGFDYVDSSGFSPVTRPWIARLVEELSGSPSGGTLISLDTAAELFFVLKQLPEREFPGGKWATIQHLEAQIEKVVADGLVRAENPA